ncbi:MAG TPA: hypothetical protein VNQ78_21385 [Paracoccus sp. (in: a-proteobacteria)]|uniref:hypothetical protein n=1 Tax=Paracoccus sp. TaxID=267 RepID=UPI002CE0BDB3|nr:hypothetical protein [Paracoccus sp. (in: a-proteobacteria)]HWL59215.1 hypothetical protein [Paracoccus sp. (in: a-proteobacteria)]
MDQPEREVMLASISAALAELEASGDIVICTATPRIPATRLYEAIRAEMMETPLTGQELRGLGELIREVLYGGALSAEELATRTGLSAEEFEAIRKKLPRE